MRTTRVLAIAAILGIVFSFRASANVVYDSETTNEWFAVDMSTLTMEALKSSPWTSPSDDGEAKVEGNVIKLDTDFGNPLTYTAQDRDSTNVAIVAVEMTAAVNVSAPDLSPVPQAALCVIGTDTATNWVGLVGTTENDEGYKWETFTTSAPVAGEIYSVRIEFDQRQGQRKIRYRVGDTVLGTGWYSNPKTTDETNIKSVSFSGVGDISGLGGSNVVENAATFNGIGYATVEAAIAKAEEAGSAWSASNPVFLYADATYEATATKSVFFNANGHVLTITGGVYKQNGVTYEITVEADCEAKIGSTFYATFDEAVGKAGANDVILVNKTLARDLEITKSLGVDPDGKLTCSTLTVGNGVTFNLAGALSVETATVNGTVTGEGILTVTGTLTGVNVAKLTFGNTATFAYGDAPIASTTTLTLGSRLTITGLDTADFGTVVIDNAAVAGATLSEFNATVKDGAELAISGNQLKVVKTEEPGVDIAIKIGDDTAGFDFTNGTINVNTTVKSGVSGTLTLTVVDFDGKARASVEKTVTDATKQVVFDLDDLTAGGTYSYTIAVSEGGKDLGTAYGEFTAANWDDDVWFGADAAKGEGQRVVGGAWETEPAISNHVYVIEENSVFNVTEDKQDQGSNRVTRVDAKVMFESLVDGEVDVPESGALGGFVATTEGWKALAAGAWVTLTGGSLPVAGKPYVIRAEVDFLSATKRVRYLVSEDDGKTFVPLSNGPAQWIDLVVQDKSLLAKVELQGSGQLAMFEARVADKALAKVGDVEYDTMEEALAAAGTNGAYQITLLTNATIEPEEKGKYEIAPGDYWYVSGGKVASGDRTIIVDDPAKPPLVRPTDTEMKKVMTPDGKSYKDYDSLRKFLEKNKVEGYTDDDADAQSVSNALETVDEANTLHLWQDYALGIDVGTSVAPVTVPTGDKADDVITLAIPAVDPAKYSGDYDITYKVVDKDGKVDPAQQKPEEIKVPLGTGTYSIKAVFTPKN